MLKHLYCESISPDENSKLLLSLFNMCIEPSVCLAVYVRQVPNYNLIIQQKEPTQEAEQDGGKF